MTNASNFRWGLPSASIYFRNDVKAKSSVKSSLGVPEYGMTSAINLGWVFPYQQPPKGEKGIVFKGMAPWVNNSVTSSIWVS